MKKVNQILMGKGMDRILPYAPWKAHPESLAFKGGQHPKVIGHGMIGRGPPPPPPPPKDPPKNPPGGNINPPPPPPPPPPPVAPPSIVNPPSREPPNGSSSSQRTNELIGAIAGSLTGTVVAVIAVKRLIALIPADKITELQADVLNTLMEFASEPAIHRLAQEGLVDARLERLLSTSFENAHVPNDVMNRSRRGTKTFLGAVGTLSGDILQQVVAKIQQQGVRLVQIRDELAAELLQAADEIRQLPDQVQEAVLEEVSRQRGNVEDVGRDILAEVNAALADFEESKSPIAKEPESISPEVITQVMQQFREMSLADQNSVLKKQKEFKELFESKGLPENVEVRNDGEIRLWFRDGSSQPLKLVEDGFGGFKFKFPV